MPRNAPYVLDPYNTFRDIRLPVAPPPDLLTEARQQLQQQANPAQPAEAALATPNQDEYGIFGPQYAAALARPTGASGADAINFANLSMQAHGERSAYEHALERAQQGAVQLADQHGYYDVLTSMQAHEPNRVVSDTHSVQIDPVTHRATIVADPTASRVDNQVRLNTAQAASRKDNASAIHDLYQSGIQTPPETVEGYMTPPTQQTPDQYGVFGATGYNPADQNDAEELPIKQLQAEAAMRAAGAAELRAQRGTPDTVTYQYMPGADQPIVTERVHGGRDPSRGGSGAGGAPAAQNGPTPQQQTRMSAVQAHGAQTQMSGNILVAVHNGRTYLYGPDGEQIQQPQAPPGQGRGGAHPAAFSLNGVAGTRSHNSPTRIYEHGTPISNADQVIAQVFPSAHITQTDRDPNSALGRANPTSWHNRSRPNHRPVVDMRAIPGLSFQQAANMIRGQGFRIIEGRDEVHDPSGHATGPHWHWVLGS